MDGLMIPGQQDTGKGHCDEIGYERYICKKKKKKTNIWKNGTFIIMSLLSCQIFFH